MAEIEHGVLLAGGSTWEASTAAKGTRATGAMPACRAPVDQTQRGRTDVARMEEAHCCLSTTTAGPQQHAAG